VPFYLVLIASLSACIPIGIRGTSVTDAGNRPRAALLPGGAGTVRMPVPEIGAVTERTPAAALSFRARTV
jgi:hypothetical protein